MELQQLLFRQNFEKEVVYESENFQNESASLVLVFAKRKTFETYKPYENLKKIYPSAIIVSASSSGQISNNDKIEFGIVVTAIAFQKTKIKATQIDITPEGQLVNLKNKIQYELIEDDLKGLLIMSEGTFVNGSELIRELREHTNCQVPIFGGLAGDDFKFKKTIVGLNENPKIGKIVLVGFYGDSINFEFASKGGWDNFGPEREVTLSNKNVLYKIGDRYALDLYKEYLGKYANELPSSSLYFPLSLKETPDSESVIRTILSINEVNKSMTFAGNIPQGAYVRLMKGNLDRLIKASHDAALQCSTHSFKTCQLAVLISCVGRRVVLGNRTEEEIEVVREVFGDNIIFSGFYSYGEISPSSNNLGCELYNYSMTIVKIFED